MGYWGPWCPLLPKSLSWVVVNRVCDFVTFARLSAPAPLSTRQKWKVRSNRTESRRRRSQAQSRLIYRSQSKWWHSPSAHFVTLWHSPHCPPLFHPRRTASRLHLPSLVSKIIDVDLQTFFVEDTGSYQTVLRSFSSALHPPLEEPRPRTHPAIKMEDSTPTTPPRRPRKVNNMRSIHDNVHGYGASHILVNKRLAI
jgi:hypothetical protein